MVFDARMAESSPLKVLPCKRVKYDIDFEQCIVCQKKKDDSLVRAQTTGLQSSTSASRQRRDHLADVLHQTTCQIDIIGHAIALIQATLISDMQQTCY